MCSLYYLKIEKILHYEYVQNFDCYIGEMWFDVIKLALIYLTFVYPWVVD